MNARRVKIARRRQVEISLPPSKSYTNRALIAASLADGESTIRNASSSEDTGLLIESLRRFGIGIARSGKDLTVLGRGGRFEPGNRTVYLGNAGTAVRFVAALAALAPGETLLEGNGEMNGRPMDGLIGALGEAGVTVSSNNGRTPLRIGGGSMRGGQVRIDAHKSSQFLSSLLLVSPCTVPGTDILPTAPVPSLPYVEMTISVMEAFGASVRRQGTGYRIEPTGYRPSDYTVEADISGSTFFASAAAITGSTVTMAGVSEYSLQADLAIYSCFRRMGCDVRFHREGVEITGPPRLEGLETDLNRAPDSVPPLAVTAAFAAGPSVIANIGHLAYKETDRLRALRTELPKIGAIVGGTADTLVVKPGTPVPSVIEPYDDHRLAMSFAVAGLRIDGTEILNPGCVGKSFPGFWDELEKFT